jgi:hypothetical protein
MHNNGPRSQREVEQRAYYDLLNGKYVVFGRSCCGYGEFDSGMPVVENAVFDRCQAAAVQESIRDSRLWYRLGHRLQNDGATESINAVWNRGDIHHFCCTTSASTASPLASRGRTCRVQRVGLHFQPRPSSEYQYSVQNQMKALWEVP